jgi:hypothetical protein
MRFLFLLATTAIACADPARIHVFIALADNKHQGIQPVPEKIGNGEDPANNLYWGCSEALKPVLKRDGEWKLTSSEAGSKAAIIERAIFTHKNGKWQIVADVYRGTAIEECTRDFFAALANPEPVEKFPLAAYIGHDGLMDFQLAADVTAKAGPGRSAVVLCCKSQQFFGPHLEKVGAKPVLLTTQLMYPGGFVLRDALAGWTRGETPAQIRQRAAAGYAKNQGMSVKAAAGVVATGIR